MTYHKNKLLNRKKFNVDICFLNSHGPVSDMYRASKFEKFITLIQILLYLSLNFLIFYQKISMTLFIPAVYELAYYVGL